MILLCAEKERIDDKKSERQYFSFEPALHILVHDLTAAEGVSMAKMSRDQIREAADLREDVSLASFADTRMKTSDRKAALSHEDTWE